MLLFMLSFLLLHFLAVLLVTLLVVKSVLFIRDRLWLRSFLRVDPFDWARASSQEDRKSLLGREFENACTLYQYKVLSFLRKYCEQHQNELYGNGPKSIEEFFTFLRNGRTRVIAFRKIVSIPFGQRKREITNVEAFVVSVGNDEHSIDIALPGGLPEELQNTFAQIVRASHILFNS